VKLSTYLAPVPKHCVELYLHFDTVLILSTQTSRLSILCSFIQVFSIFRCIYMHLVKVFYMDVNRMYHVYISDALYLNCSHFVQLWIIIWCLEIITYIKIIEGERAVTTVAERWFCASAAGTPVCLGHRRSSQCPSLKWNQSIGLDGAGVCVWDTSGSSNQWPLRKQHKSAEILHRECAFVLLCMPLWWADTLQAKLVDNCSWTFVLI
jgi:hypothetical protein